MNRLTNNEEQNCLEQNDRLGIILVNFHSEDYLEDCLNSLLNQSYPITQIVIVNNGNQLPLPDLPKHASHITLIDNQENVGFAKANNQAAEILSDCQWIACVNPDVELEHDYFERLIEAAKEMPQTGAWQGELRTKEDLNRLDGVGDCYHIAGLAYRKGYGHSIEQSNTLTQPIFSVCAAAALYRASLFHSLNGFDESFFAYIEDVDLGFRIRLAGYDCQVVSGAIATHVGSVSTRKNHRRRFYLGHRNLVWCYYKNTPAKLLIRSFVKHSFVQVSSLIYFSLKGYPIAIFKAKWDALLGLPRILRARKRQFALELVQNGYNEQLLRQSMLHSWKSIFSRR